MKLLLLSTALSGLTSAADYIIRLKSGDSSVSSVVSTLPNESVKRTFRIGNFAAILADLNNVDDLNNNEDVDSVSPNDKMFLYGPLPQRGTTFRIPYSLDRVDQRDLPLDGSYTPFGRAGAGVNVYVLDSGIDADHPEFGGRARLGLNAVIGTTDRDLDGHGTHVAGTVGSTNYGIAPRANIIGVKVCTEEGCSFGDILAGLEYVHNDARGKKAVANMSLGVAGSVPDIEKAVRELIASGVQVAIASGNDGRDACNYSPAKVAEAVTVNASGSQDEETIFSNYGACTDIFAPGDDVLSLRVGGGVVYESGTSMAAPNVAGVMALYLAENNYSPAALKRELLESATAGRIRSISRNTPNRLVYARPGRAGGSRPVDPEPEPEPEPELPGCGTVLCCYFGIC